VIVFSDQDAIQAPFDGRAQKPPIALLPFSF
jgi:hypothetical protein